MLECQMWRRGGVGRGYTCPERSCLPVTHLLCSPCSLVRCCHPSPRQPLPGQPAPAADTEPASGEPCSWEQCVFWIWSRGGARGPRDLSSPTLGIGGQWLFIDPTRPCSNENGRQCGHSPVSSSDDGHNQPLPSLVPGWDLPE